MIDALSPRYTFAAPPDLYSGVGHALRRAFKVSERSITHFEKLLGRINRR